MKRHMLAVAIISLAVACMYSQQSYSPVVQAQVLV